MERKAGSPDLAIRMAARSRHLMNPVAMKPSLFRAVLQVLLLIGVGAIVQAQPAPPTVTLGPPSRIPIPPSGAYYYANDAAAPYLPVASGNTNLTFWVAGVTCRSTGATLDTLGPVNPTTSVLSGGPTGTFDGNGVWLINAIRKSDGTLMGFYHAEDHTFVDGTYGEWNSTGLATSSDDGITWIKQGQIIGSQKPATGAFGGVGATCVLYNHITSTWMGIGNGTGFQSSDPNAAPGT